MEKKDKSLKCAVYYISVPVYMYTIYGHIDMEHSVVMKGTHIYNYNNS